ncbi:MAG: PEP-CTERM sorting domain-containing protein, partial [Isosphaeraceae bacterium]|nr:PEP-CTERM sorting domain-containing protein [Isosphaeraceae bacterium]
ELAIDSLGNAFGWSEASTDDLASLDLGTGLVNGIVGDAGLSTAALSLAFDLDNTLYLMNGDAGTYEIDASTGAASFVGFLGRLLHHGDVDPDTGLFYGIATFGSPTEIDVGDRSDLETLGTLVVDDVRFHTLAFVPTNVVPEPSTLAGMAAGAAIALVAARRRRTA